MNEIHVIAISGLSVLIWLSLLFARGGFWRADQRLGRAGELVNWPDVVAVIPARNEAETIDQTVSSLLEQDYPGEFRVVVVDDNSTDGTAAAAGQSFRLDVISGQPLEAGWTGKLWAVKQGLEAAEEFAADAEYVLLTDADITHDSANLRELVFKASKEDFHLVSLMVKLRCQSFWERLLIPAFVFFFQKLYPFRWVNTSANRMAAAAGGCMLIRLDTLRRAGGVEMIRDRLIDDCALGTLIKAKGAIWLGLAGQTFSSRSYDQLSEIWNMVARTAFVQLDHSVLNLSGTVMAMIVIYLTHASTRYVAKFRFLFQPVRNWQAKIFQERRIKHLAHVSGAGIRQYCNNGVSGAHVLCHTDICHTPAPRCRNTQTISHP